MMEEGQSRVLATYRDNFDRLSKIKSRYDPGNLFRVNQKILPRFDGLQEPNAFNGRPVKADGVTQRLPAGHCEVIPARASGKS